MNLPILLILFVKCCPLFVGKLDLLSLFSLLETPEYGMFTCVN
uniref:Uncharacterized protein n=1 Tax=Arundo donax TaxID=35708 RepID=A0A0A9GMF0_ARUDO